MSSISKRKELLFKILTPIFSLTICLFLAETAYRVRLYHFLQRQDMEQSYLVVNSTPYAYDEEYGYHYVPNATYVWVGIQRGQPGRVIYCWSGSVNEEGNIGIKNTLWSPNDFKVLVVGDSFSAMPAGPDGSVTWTDFLPGALSECASTRVSVKNYARDGYGILQMFHLALGMAHIYNPDLILVAFITDDLTRSRFYRSTSTVCSEERILTSIKIGNPPDMRYATDTMMLNPKVTAQWCHLPQHEQEEILLELHSQYDRLSSSRLSLDLKTMSKSFLYDRIVRGDPFYSSFEPSRNPRIDYNDYSEDLLFTSDVRGLRDLNVPLSLVHIPDMSEMKAGRYLVNSEKEHLIKSLEHITGSKIMGLLPLVEHPAKWEELFLVPYDVHPSELGAAFYAKMIANSLCRCVRSQKGAHGPKNTVVMRLPVPRSATE